MAVSLLGLGLALGGGPAVAQAPPAPPSEPAWVVVPVDRAPRPAEPAREPGAASGMPVNWRSAGVPNAPQVPAAPTSFSATPPVPPGAMAPVAGSLNPAKSDVAAPDGPDALAQAPLPRGQLPAPVKAPTEDALGVPQIQLTPPGTDRLFRRESEKSFQERMRQEARGRQPLDRIEFPPEPVLSTEKYAGRNFPPAREIVEPNYVCYDRLYFEQLNSERYGWDLGFFHPIFSAGKFYWDLILLPYHMGTAPCRHYDCNSGYCLPGDPVPLLLYPPDISLTGAVLETTTIVGLYMLFPG